jgi:uncharacterized RDD family membrane protein YckC
MEEHKYGKLINRLKAIFIDGLVIIGLSLLVSAIFAQFDHVNNAIRAIAFILIFLLYDPIMTSTNGATIGHMIIGLKVRRENDEEKKISFPLALIRFIVKAFLGFISLLTISDKNKGKAIHDSIVGSIVLQN